MKSLHTTDGPIHRISRGFRGVNQAWNEYKTVGCIITPGKDYGKVVELARGHITCPECHRIVKPDKRGFAFCNCRIWNDGTPVNRENRSHRAPIERARKRFARSLVAR